MRISIIIPSRERAQYLAHSLRTVTDIDDPNIEILVSDNASGDDTQAVVAANDDPRLRYLNTGRRLSMRQNFEFALKNSTGDYVIMFGDDDGLIPSQFPILRHLLEQHRPDGLSWDFLTYGWPVGSITGKAGGMRFRRNTTFGQPQLNDTDAMRRDMANAVLEGPQRFPALYHGCMSRAFLNSLADPSGEIFLARSPDVYITYRALVAGGRFMHLPHPLSINGFSPASTGGNMRDLGQSDKSDKDTRFLTEVQQDPVDDIVPVVKSMSLAFLGTLQTVLHHFPDQCIQIDAEAWYRRSLNDAAHKNSATADEIRASLTDNAAQFGTEDALHRAQTRAVARKSSRFSRFVAKVKALRGSLRRSAHIDGQNTIHTAAKMADAILGDDMHQVLSGTLSRHKAWANARKRSAGFDRQL